MITERWLGDCRVVPFNKQLFESFWASISHVSAIVMAMEKDVPPKECLGCGGQNPEYFRAYELEGQASIIPVCEKCHREKSQ